MEWRKKKGWKKVDTCSSLERKLKPDFLHVCLPGHQSDNVFVCMYNCHPVCLASLVNSNYRWTYRRVNNGKERKRCEKNAAILVCMQSHVKIQYHSSRQTHSSIRHAMSFVCGQSKGHTGQGFQMFPIILQPWQDLPGHPTLRLSLLRIKQEGWKLINLLDARYLLARISLRHGPVWSKHMKQPLPWWQGPV